MSSLKNPFPLVNVSIDITSKGFVRPEILEKIEPYTDGSNVLLSDGTLVEGQKDRNLITILLGLEFLKDGSENNLCISSRPVSRVEYLEGGIKLMDIEDQQKPLFYSSNFPMYTLIALFDICNSRLLDKTTFLENFIRNFGQSQVDHVVRGDNGGNRSTLLDEHYKGNAIWFSQRQKLKYF